MQAKAKRLVRILLSLGFIICFAWGALTVYSVDVHGMRVLGGIGKSKQMASELCEYKNKNKHYPSSYEPDHKSSHMKDFKYTLHNDKFTIEFRVENILRADTYFTVNSERISMRAGMSGEPYGEPVGRCE